jgi:hypothetical protein
MISIEFVRDGRWKDVLIDLGSDSDSVAVTPSLPLPKTPFTIQYSSDFILMPKP